MLNFFSYILSIFQQDNENAVKNRELKLIFKTLHAKKNKYITKERVLTQQFANKMFFFYEQTSTIRDFLAKTLFNKDEQRRRLFLHFYIDSFLPEEMMKKKDNFDKNLMLKRLKESGNPQKMLETIEHDFVNFKKIYQRENMPQVEEEYNFFYLLYHLATFDFESFFLKIDLSFNPNMPKLPTIKDCDAKRISDDLKDFYYIIASLKRPPENSNNSVEKLIVRERGDNGKILAEKTQNAINTVFKLLQNDLVPEVIINMIRYIDSDPQLKIKIANEHIAVLDSYRKDISNIFAKTKDTVLQMYNAESIQKEITNLFQQTPLQSIPGYDDDLIVHLDERKLELRGMQALKVSKTFIKIYEGAFREQINIFLVSGLFNDKDFQRHFSDCYFKINELKDSFLSLEKEIKTDPESSLTALESLMSTPKSTITEKKIKMITAEINVLTNTFLRHSFIVFHNFASDMEVILKDYKSQAPQKINNIRTIKGAGTKDFMTSMIEFYNMMVKYTKLLKKIVPPEESEES